MVSLAHWELLRHGEKQLKHKYSVTKALLSKLRDMSVDSTTLLCVVTFWTDHDCLVVFPPKRRQLFINRHGLTSRKTWLFVIIAVGTSNLLHETPKHSVFYISYCQHASFHPLLFEAKFPTSINRWLTLNICVFLGSRRKDEQFCTKRWRGFPEFHLILTHSLPAI